MNAFKEASKQKLRVSTFAGMLSVEQLWDLSMTKLATIVRDLKKELNKDNDSELSFLDETLVVDKVKELSFEVVKEIYIDKRDEMKARREAADIKAHNERILALIHKKQEEDLGERSIEELQALLK